MPTTPSSPRKDAMLAAAVALAVSALYYSGEVELVDTDPVRHMEYAHQLWLSHFTLRGHPFLPFTTLGDSGADLWLGFHWLLVPFTFLGRVTGGRVAGACCAAAHAGALAALLSLAGARRAWLFASAPIVLSEFFAVRDHLARPSHLALALLYVNLWAGAGWLRPRAAALASFAHGLLHLSSPFSPLFCGIGWLAARATGRRTGGRAVLWSVGALALAFLVRPDRQTYLPAALSHDLVALGGGHALPDRGVELMRPSLVAVVLALWPLVLLLVAAIVLGRGRRRSGPRELRLALAAVLVLSLLLTVQAARFLDFDVGFLAAAAALLWPAELAMTAGRKWAAAGTAAAAVALVLYDAADSGEASHEITIPSATYETIADEVRGRVAPGSVIFTDDLFRTAELWAHLPEYRFIVAYDPAILYGRSRAKYWRWHHLVTDGTLCDEPECPGEKPSPAKLTAGIGSFDSEWAVLWYPRPSTSLASFFKRAPFWFHEVRAAKAPSQEVQLWHVDLPRH